MGSTYMYVLIGFLLRTLTQAAKTLQTGDLSRATVIQKLHSFKATYNMEYSEN